MLPSKNDIRLSPLREDICQPVLLFVGKLLADLHSHIESISVVGSSLTADYIPGRSDINTVVIFRTGLLESLDAVAALGKSLGRKHLAPPLLLTADYLNKSRDTFPIELLDFQLNHCTVFGEDPFIPLTFNKKDVRLQCERELKSILLRLSQGYISCGAGAEPVAGLLISAVAGMAPLLRAMLWLKDIDRSGPFEQVFTKAAQAFSFEPGMLIEIRKWKSAKRLPPKDTVAKTFASIYELLSHLAAAVENIKVSE